MAGDYTRTLDYSIGGGPMIWRSLLWMLLAWEVVAVQFGYIGLRLWERFGNIGLLMIGLLGAINIPFYEEMAHRIHWWQYSACRMVPPWYTILGEFAIALAFALLARTLRRDSWRIAIVSGIAGGASICLLRCRLSDYRSINWLSRMKNLNRVCTLCGNLKLGDCYARECADHRCHSGQNACSDETCYRRARSA